MEQLQAPSTPTSPAWVREYVDDEPHWELVEYTGVPAPQSRLVETSLLTRGDLIRLPVGDVVVTEVTPFFGGAYIQWEAQDVATTVPMSDEAPVLLLATAAEQQPTHLELAAQA